MLAIIPCRGGSKRLPGKNTMKTALGEPLWRLALNFALDNQPVDMTPVVTTDMQHVWRWCQGKYRCIARRPELCTDDARMEDVIIDVLDSTGLQEDAFVLLQPTSPIRDRAYLEEAIRMLRDVSCVISTDPWGRRNGNLFVCRIPYFRQYEFGGPSVCHLPMPAMMSLDIDTDTDLAAYRQVEKEALNCQ